MTPLVINGRFFGREAADLAEKILDDCYRCGWEHSNFLARFTKADDLKSAMIRWALSFAVAASFGMSGSASVQSSSLATGPHMFMSGSVRLWYRVAGPSHGEPVVFLHGGPAEGSQGFARTVGPMLERGLRMVYFDQRGAGHSDRPASADAYSMAIIVEDIERLRRHLGAARIALVGHSYGSMLALEYAARYPQHVTRIVLAGAVPDSIAALNAQCAWLSRFNPEAYVLAKKAADQPGDPDCIPMEGFKGKAKRDYFIEASGGKRETLDRLEEADAAEGVTIDGPAHLALAEPSLHYAFSHPERLKMPILAISGSRDRLSDEKPVAIFISKVAHGRLLQYPGAGHFSYVDDPARFAEDVTSFLR